MGSPPSVLQSASTYFSTYFSGDKRWERRETQLRRLGCPLQQAKSTKRRHSTLSTESTISVTLKSLMTDLSRLQDGVPQFQRAEFRVFLKFFNQSTREIARNNIIQLQVCLLRLFSGKFSYGILPHMSLS